MPFGPNCEYATFDECVKANKDKKDPDAYCATIMRDTEEHCKNKSFVTVMRDLFTRFKRG
jgi:hypothetical protein